MSKFSSTTTTAAPWSRAETAAARPAAPAPMTTTSVERFHSIRKNALGRTSGRHHAEAGLAVKAGFRFRAAKTGELPLVRRGGLAVLGRGRDQRIGDSVAVMG